MTDQSGVGSGFRQRVREDMSDLQTVDCIILQQPLIVVLSSVVVNQKKHKKQKKQKKQNKQKKQKKKKKVMIGR
jgi:uncharacterized membrane protein